MAKKTEKDDVKKVDAELVEPKASKSSKKAVKFVKATKTGYYDLKLREAGEHFILESPEDFSEKWMAPADKQELPTNDHVSHKRMKMSWDEYEKEYGSEGPTADEVVQPKGTRPVPKQEVI